MSRKLPRGRERKGAVVTADPEETSSSTSVRTIQERAELSGDPFLDHSVGGGFYQLPVSAADKRLTG
jgi:hypothetical protein